MKKVILLLAALCSAMLVFNSLAQTTQPSASDRLTELKGYSDANLSIINATPTVSPAIDIAQAIKFQPPKAGWKLLMISIMATDRWNTSISSFPTPLPFTIEIRDKELNLLYHFADTQLSYFTHPDIIALADIEVPPMTLSEEFYVCFYGYYLIPLMTELQNATGNSFYYVRQTGQLVPAELQLKNNSTLPVNWVISVGGL